MDSHGRPNFLGLNYQSWAALSLFLQNLRSSEFVSMHLEAPKMQDFDLHFKDGRRVICEAKGRKSAFSLPQLKKLLADLDKRKVQLSDKDEILIVTTSATNELKRVLKRVRDLPPSFFKDAVKGTEFRPKDVPLLKKTQIYEIAQEDSSEIAFALMSELIEGWVDPHVLKQIVQSTLVDKIYHGSAKGLVVEATEFKELVKQESKRLRDNVGVGSQPTKERLKLINDAIKDSQHPLWASANLSALSAHWGEIIYASTLLKEKTNLKLNEWSNVITALIGMRISHRAFEIIENNLDTEVNLDFATQFLLKDSKKLRASYSFDFRESALIKLSVEIFKKDSSRGAPILEALQALVGNIGRSKLFVKSRDRSEYLRDQAGSLTKLLYEQGDKKLKEKVVEFISTSFCLVEDEGEYWHKTPPGAFEVLRDYLCMSAEGFEKRFKEFVILLSKQFSEIYKRKFSMPFKGYELYGGVSSWWGNNYNVKDRHFIQRTLSPALDWYVSKDKSKAFAFIQKQCVFDDKKVKYDKPDFLRRAAIPVLASIYKDDILGRRDESRKLLFALSSSKKGIPTKHHLIYQAALLISDPDLLWSLISDALKLSDRPLNPFVENAVCSLASRRDSNALTVVNKWLQQEDFWTDSLFGGGPLNLLRSLAAVDSDSAIQTLEGAVFGKYFNRSGREIDIYDWCDFLESLFSTHGKKVKTLLKKLSSLDELSDSQQILVIGTIGKIGKEEKNSEQEKIELYKEVVSLILADPQFVDKFKISHVREQLTDFVEGLVKQEPTEKAVECALEILEVLANDPSPEPDKNKSLENDKEVFAIETVRGKTAWVLQHFFKPVARPYLARTISVLERLLTDESDYIRGMACYPFSVLLGNRYTFTTKDLSQPFLADSRDLAFQEAKRLEKRAVKFIGDNLNLTKNLTKNIPKLYDRLRLVDFDSAKELWGLAESGGIDLMKEVLPIIIFNAHFRESLVSGAQVKGNPFLGNLAKESFDYDYWKDKLEALTSHENEELRASLSWHIMKISDVEEDKRAAQNVAVSLKYFKLLALWYNQDVFRSIYMFINEHHKKHSEECLNLWFTLISVEGKAIKDALAKGAALYEVQWWPFCFNSDILLWMYKSGRVDLFLQGISELLEYPEGVITGLDEKVADALAHVSSDHDKVGQLFDKWVERDYLRLKDKEAWEQSLK